MCSSDLVGVDTIVLHCHDYRRYADSRDRCDRDRRALEAGGYRVVYRDERDVRLAGDRPAAPLRMFYDRIDPRWLHLEGVDAARGSWRLHLRVLGGPVFVAFPRACYPARVHLYGETRRVTLDTCIRFYYLAVERFVLYVPETPGTTHVGLEASSKRVLWRLRVR